MRYLFSSEIASYRDALTSERKDLKHAIVRHELRLVAKLLANKTQTIRWIIGMMIAMNALNLVAVKLFFA